MDDHAATARPRDRDRPRLEPLVGPSLEAIPLDADGTVTLGRGRTCEGVLPHGTVSRRHAELRFVGSRWTLRDLGSRHGTIVNGTPLEHEKPTPLSGGDLIAIGPWTLRVVLPGTGGVNGPASSRPLPAETAPISPQSPADRVEEIEPEPDAGLAQQRLSLLLGCASALHAATKIEALADAVVSAALEGTGFGRAALLRTSETSGFQDTRAETNTSEGERVELVSARVAPFAETGSAIAEPFSVSASLIRGASGGQTARLSAMRGSDSAEYGESIDDLRIHEAMCVPVIVGGLVDCYLYLDARGPEQEAPRDAGVFLQALAQLASLAIAEQRRREIERRHNALQVELSAAHAAQQLIVPPPRGSIGPVRYSLRTRPGMVVAGDLFDILELPDGRTAFFLGDVTGEGVSAGMLMASAQGHLHASLVQHLDPAVAVRAVNDYLASHTPPDRFITLWTGVLDHERGEMTYVDAGHGHAVHIPAGGSPEKLPQAGGIPAAIEPGIPYESQTIPFGPRDRLVLFSDGLIEQTRHAEDAGTAPDDRRVRRYEFGIDRVLDVLARSKRPDDDTRRLLAAVLDFAAASALDDDTTIASIEWCEDESRASERPPSG